MKRTLAFFAFFASASANAGLAPRDIIMRCEFEGYAEVDSKITTFEGSRIIRVSLDATVSNWSKDKWRPASCRTWNSCSVSSDIIRLGLTEEAQEDKPDRYRRIQRNNNIVIDRKSGSYHIDSAVFADEWMRYRSENSIDGGAIGYITPIDSPENQIGREFGAGRCIEIKDPSF